MTVVAYENTISDVCGVRFRGCWQPKISGSFLLLRCGHQDNADVNRKEYLEKSPVRACGSGLADYRVSFGRDERTEDELSDT